MLWCLLVLSSPPFAPVEVTGAQVSVVSGELRLDLETSAPTTPDRVTAVWESSRVVVLRVLDARAKRRYLKGPKLVQRALLHRSRGARPIANLRVRLRHRPRWSARRDAVVEVTGRRVRMRIDATRPRRAPEPVAAETSAGAEPRVVTEAPDSGEPETPKAAEPERVTGASQEGVAADAQEVVVGSTPEPEPESEPEPEPEPEAAGSPPEPVAEAKPVGPEPEPTPSREARTQFILLSIDSTPRDEEGYHERLRARLRPFGDATFTLFISTGGLTLAKTWTPPRASPWAADPKQAWQAYLGNPKLPRNRPAVKYARHPGEILETVARIKRLHAAGVEIGSHGVRHEWSRERPYQKPWGTPRWTQEFSDHQRILDLFDLPSPAGFRAPFLDVNRAMFTALDEAAIAYDASSVWGRAMRWPRRHRDTSVWAFGIPQVDLPGGRRGLLFDISMKRRLERVRQADPELSNGHKWRTLNRLYSKVLQEEFARRFRSNRAPLLISGHGGFMIPNVQFMKRVCGRPQVRCGTFSEVVAYLRRHPGLEGDSAW